MTADPRRQLSRTSERLKAYTDAVVAIAQTLLILPLLESVSEAKAHHLTTPQWLTENTDAIIWLVMSFVLIGSFWVTHHRVFEQVEHLTGRLIGLNFMWMLGIIFFPVIAAVLGLSPSDETQKVLYIGCLLMCSVAMNGMVVLINRDARLREDQPQLGAGSVAASFGQTILYVLALLLALQIPGGAGYFALGVLALMPVAVRLLMPLVRRWGLGG